MFIIFVIFAKLHFYVTICLYKFNFTDANNIYKFEATECFHFCQYDNSFNVGTPICWG